MKNPVYFYVLIIISTRVASDLFKSDSLYYFMDGVIMAVTAIYLFYQSIPSLRNKIALGGLLLLCFCQSLNQMVAMLIDNIYFYWFQIVIYMVGVAELLLWTYENWSDVREWFINKIISFKRWLDGL